MNAIERAAQEHTDNITYLDVIREDQVTEAFVAGAKFALAKVRKDLCRELTNICDFDVYVEPSYYTDSINGIIKNIDKLV